MSNTNTGGPAFPTTVYTNDDFKGMTLRDYFAGKAMQAQVGNPLKLGDDESHRLIAERAYRMADAMLKARDA
jgi:hypothetical protein